MIVYDTSERKVTKKRREEVEENTYKFVEYEEDNAYYVGLLNEYDREFIKGIRYIKEMAIESFFNNLDVYEGEIGECEVKSDVKPIMQMLSDNQGKAEVLKECLLDWIDKEENEIVVSMIDNMDEEEYRNSYIREFGKESYERNIGE